MSKRRVLSGMRPTGSMHLGNYHGALANWVEMQEEYECYYFAADWHALTTPGNPQTGAAGYEFTEGLERLTREMILDWLSVGLDPQKSCIFVQSAIPEVAELYLLFAMITPNQWCLRNPTVQEQIEQLGIDTPHYGLIGYPVLQAADILIYKAHYVPVGRDQERHVWLSADIAKRFNYFYGEVFPIPEAKFTVVPRVPGTDKAKMSKSAGNHIGLQFTPEETQKAIQTMFTDPQKVRRNDPGNPVSEEEGGSGCVVYAFHQLYNPAEVPQILADCRSGSLGCVACKRRLGERMNAALEPIRARRAELEAQPGYVEEVIRDGTRRARRTAQQTLAEVREAMHLNYGFWKEGRA